MDEYDAGCGVKIKFPFTPYELQLTLMRAVVEAIENRQNALLESPTGTGKTLSLLCAALGWLEKYPSKGSESLGRPTIYFASRTHSQLTQVIKELKRSHYSHVRVSVLGSRDQLCTNAEVREKATGARLASVCRQTVKVKRCGPASRVAAAKSDPIFSADPPPIMDIEDLNKFGEEHSCCPYYISQEVFPPSKSDIVFLPYNYLTDPVSRSSQKIDLKNSILIFDESHNLESSCRDVSSWEISTSMMENCAAQLEVAKGSAPPEYSSTYVKLKEATLQISFLLKSALGTNSEKTKPGDVVLQIFKDAGIEEKTWQKYEEVIKYTSKLLGRAAPKNSMLLNFSKIVQACISHSPTEKLFWKAHKLHIKLDRERSAKSATTNVTASFMCLSSGIVMQTFLDLGARSIILASGTLAPLESFAREMTIKFDHRLENPHVVTNQQFMIGILPKGPTSVKLNGSYGNRRINDKKRIFVEPSNKNDFAREIEKYYAEVDRKGACFFAVCRGKASEGIDFSDDRARTVIVIGVPFPNSGDQQVILKKEFLNQTTPGSGNIWYKQQALRAVNQAIGRVIRHKNDHGAILLLDYRYENHRRDLPKWTQANVSLFEGFGVMQKSLAAFFREKRVESGSLMAPSEVGPRESKPVSSTVTSTEIASVRSTSSRNLPRSHQTSLGILEQFSESLRPRELNRPSDMSMPSSMVQNPKLHNKRPIVSPMVSRPASKRIPSFNDPPASKSGSLLKSLSTSSSVQMNPNASTARQASRAKYLKDVRSCLVEDQYRSFESAVREYKISPEPKDIGRLLSNLRRVFDDIVSRIQHVCER
ncbi:MAG: hypothetical protein SGCHY_002794 [Lobulomycetales sp.]